jgi:flagellar assembly protein FliH
VTIHMSARLIKGSSNNSGDAVALFMPTGQRAAARSNTAVAPVFAPRTDHDADSIIEQARIRAAQIEREATQNAHALIQAEVDQEVVRTIDPWREQLSNTLHDLDGLRVSIAAQAEKEVARLAIEIAKKIVHREVTIDNDIVLTLARIGLSRMHNRIAATIHLHPDDIAYVESHRNKLNAAQALSFIEDHSVGRGGCLLHTDMGDVDARIEQQFAEIERAFIGS